MNYFYPVEFDLPRICIVDTIKRCNFAKNIRI